MNMLLVQLSLLALTALAGPVHTLVLRSGERLPVREELRVESDTVVFRAPGGALHSIRLSEVDLEQTEKANESSSDAEVRKPAGPERTAEEARRDFDRLFRSDGLSGRPIVVSEEEKRRLLDELSKSRGVPVSPEPISATPGGDSPEPTTAADSRGEQWWRSQSRRHDEHVERARTRLKQLVDAERRLQGEILSMLSLGWGGDQLSLQVLQLANTRDSIPPAREAVRRAEQERARFLDDARRQGILPGWLR